jgi:hypothetical protein
LTGLLVPAVGASPQSEDHRDRFFRPDRIPALILSGRNNHDWRRSTPFLRQVLEHSGRFDVRVVEEPAGLTAATFAPYQVVILDYQGPRLGEQTESALAGFIRGGKGLVVVHGASYGFSGLDVLADGHVSTGLREAPWEEFPALVGGVWSEENPRSAHGVRHTFTVRFRRPEHPIAAGMPAAFSATDELYHDLRMHPSAQVLATAFSASETGGTGQEEPVLWVVEYGRGRVFHTTLGHDLNALVEPGFVATFARGAEWAATGAVTLPPTLDPAAPEPGAPRGLLVTGGHDYDSDFYSVLEGDWLRWQHATSNQEAFRRDVTADFDVLVLYDMSADLDDNGRAHLERFARSGKGIVSIHHAIASYQNWEWWWREVVGGRYVLEGPEDRKSSYLHDVELQVRTVTRHPITRDLGPFRLVDETYRNLWISPDIQVLMATDHPTADGPVVWISPWREARVVYIQLGHDRRAHRYPGYRELVRRAVLWAAGRLAE